MPIYEYRCEQGHTFEVLQRMTDDPVAACTTCSAPVQRVFHPVAIHFKGKGFYNTDYGTRSRQRELARAAEGGDGGKSDADGKSSSSEKGSEGKSSSSDSDTGKAARAAEKAKADKPGKGSAASTKSAGSKD